MAIKSVLGDYDLQNPADFPAYGDALQQLRSTLTPISTGVYEFRSGRYHMRHMMRQVREQHEELLLRRPFVAELLLNYLSVFGTPRVRDMVGWHALRHLDVGNVERRPTALDRWQMAYIAASVLRDRECKGNDTQYLFRNVARYIIADIANSDRGAPTPEFPLLAEAYNATHPATQIQVVPYEAHGSHE